MRRILPAVLLGGLFLLMLSALVTTPQPENPIPPPVETAVVMARQQEQPQTACQQPSAGETRTLRLRLHRADLPMMLPRATDANGRVLTACRYENSVYQLLRAGVAAG